MTPGRPTDPLPPRGSSPVLLDPSIGRPLWNISRSVRKQRCQAIAFTVATSDKTCPVAVKTQADFRTECHQGPRLYLAPGGVSPSGSKMAATTPARIPHKQHLLQEGTVGAQGSFRHHFTINREAHPRSSSSFSHISLVPQSHMTIPGPITGGG